MKVISQFVPPPVSAKSYEAVGTVVGALPRGGRLIVDHEEIKGFMAAMEMSYPVTPPSLLNGLNAGDKIQFTIDGGNSTITSIRVIEYIK
jgi:Cu/Ag efflux protein CusF